MAEVQFARQFLTILETRPVKLSHDWVADPKTLPAHAAYVLPRLDKPKPKPRRGGGALAAAGAAAGSTASKGVSVTLKPLKGAAVTLNGVDPVTASVYDIKTRLGKRTGYAPEKIKVLWQKRPVTDAKTIKDVVGDAGDAAIELGVMYVGQPTAEPLDQQQEEADALRSAVPGFSAASTTAAVVDGQGDVTMKDATTMSDAEAVMSFDEFWEDLEKYVTGKIGDEKLASVATDLWRAAWTKRK